MYHKWEALQVVHQVVHKWGSTLGDSPSGEAVQEVYHPTYLFPLNCHN